MSTESEWARDVDDSLQPKLQVEEKGKRTVHQYPSDIVDQLKRAAFSEGESANTYIKRVKPTNGSSDPKVVTVEVQDDKLIIDVEDIVGIVNLTPNSTLQIDPKIGWEDILEMFFDVGYYRQSLEYRGIPIRDFLADDIGIEDIFIVVAANYLNSLDDIFRHGFIRSFDRRRVEALDARGRIDIHNSIQNFDIPNEVPKHVFVQKMVEHSIPVNDLIYLAGEELQRLFHLYSGETDNRDYMEMYSRLERSVRRLEDHGITGESISLSDAPEISMDDIPRQRHYYKQALDISKTILSSSIGQPLDQGREELLIEYIISMESLFEEYVELALTEEIESLQQNPITGGLSGVEVAKESFQLFQDESISLRSQPDHVIRSNDGVEAVLDSKYYSGEKSILKSSWSRSRLLSYGFHLETNNLAMVAPLADAGEFEFKGRSGSLAVIAPNSEEFSTDGLRKAIRGYIRDTFNEQHGCRATADLSKRRVCHPDVEASNIADLVGEEKLAPEEIIDDRRHIIEYSVTERISDVRGFRERDKAAAASREFRKYLQSKSISEWDIVVPVFVPAEDQEAEEISQDEEFLAEQPNLEGATEYIKIHCFTVDNGGTPVDYNSPVPFGLEW